MRPLLVLLLTLGCSSASVVEPDASVDASAPGDAGPRDAGPELRTVDPMFEYEPPEPTDGGMSDGAGEEVVLLVVFDKSGSMSGPWSLDEPMDGGMDDAGAADAGGFMEWSTRWTAASTAMLDAIWPHRERVTVGALLFPLQTSCGVPPIDSEAQLDFMNAEAFIDAWIDRAPVNGPAGSTPIQAAFEAADSALTRADMLGLTDRRIEVMLLTDGEPNCDTDIEEVERLAERWHSELGIRTSVMGLPGSEDAVTRLDRIAEAGGTEAHQSIGSPGQLSDAVGALL